MEIGSSSSNTQSTNRPPRSFNTLAKEGIAPANYEVFAGCQFGKPKSRRYPASDQQKIVESRSDKSNFFNTFGSKIRSKDIGTPENLYLPRSKWISLSDGWYQITPIGSGASTRCGMHSVIESSLGQLYMGIYEPRSKEVIDSCTRDPCEYDIEVSAKALKPSTSVLNYKFEIVFAFKSPTDYLSIVGDVSNGLWMISRYNGSEHTTICTSEVHDLKPNIFYFLLIQVRGNNVSVDVDNIPIFTASRLPDSINMSGLMGLLAHGTKFAVKGWKIRSMAVPRDDRIAAQRLPSEERFSLSNAGLPLPPSPLRAGGRAPMSLKDMMNRSSGGKSAGMYTNDDNSRIGPPPVRLGGGGPGINYKDPHLEEPYMGRSRTPPSIPSKRNAMCRSSYYESNEDTRGQSNQDLNSSYLEITIEEKISNCYGSLSHHHDRAVVDMVLGDIVQRDLGVTFDDISALHTAKRLLNEAVVLPMMMPELFTGIRVPWKGVLLFGPPGTGKTMLARAVAGLNHSVFFSCSAASLISKYRGESEKIVKCLFEAARICAPSIVFLDEVDALVSSRGSDTEHEASRRLKTEFFSQMDGIASSGQESCPVMVLATTNCPWDLDEAIRRRLEKRIYIPLPDFVARRDMFEKCLNSIGEVSSDITPSSLANLTAGYSGADIHLVCREAAMMPMRRLLMHYSPMELNRLKSDGQLEIPPVSGDDFDNAISNTKSSVSSECIYRYMEWDKQYGSK